jgi:hypothetical protein
LTGSAIVRTRVRRNQATRLGSVPSLFALSGSLERRRTHADNQGETDQMHALIIEHRQIAISQAGRPGLRALP